MSDYAAHPNPHGTGEIRIRRQLTAGGWLTISRADVLVDALDIVDALNAAPKREGGIAAHYDDKRRAARWLSEQLEIARRDDASPDLIRWLEHALEMARYTGD